MTDILATLEFNAVHSGHDPLTKALLAQAAEEIRKTRLERDSYRRRLAVAAADNRHIAIEANALEKALAIALEVEPTHDRP